MQNKHHRQRERDDMRQILLGILAVLMLASCDVARTTFPVTPDGQQSQSKDALAPVDIVPLTAANIAQYAQARNLSGSRGTLPSRAWIYRVGAGDVLDIVVWDHPELTLPAGAQRTPLESGMRVQSDGTFFYPYVGKVGARGRTVEVIREELATRLKEFIPDPQVEVRVVGYNSQAVSVTGEVEKPSRQSLTDVPLTLLDAINTAGGLTDEADPRAVTVRRDGKSFRVDLKAFLDDGVAANNPILQNGDVVNVARIVLQEAYLLGQVDRPSTVDLARENVTLTQALTRVGGLREDIADARGIFVFRETGPSGITVFQLDASDPVAFLIGARFVLRPGDVIYVTSAPLYRWNRLISGLLPSVTAARGVQTLSAQ